MIKQACIEQIKELALVDIAKSMGIDTKKRGANYVCCCPFHNEKTPSFSIKPTNNIGKCFGGCQTSVSNAIDFVMKYKKLDFYEAAIEAARLGNVTVEYEEEWSEEKKAVYKKTQDYKKSIYKALDIANDVFQNVLSDNPQPYLSGRKFTTDTIKHFQIGFADKYGSIFDNKEIKRCSENLLKAASLYSEKGKPFFWERIVFPIYQRGRVSGFAGRSIAENPKVKYLNSKNDEKYGTFVKSKVLYNFDEAVKNIHPKLGIVVMEGYTDVWALWQSGIKYAVATCGVALTAEHIDLLKRHTNKITLFRDNDPAGHKATMREIEMLLPHEFEINILTLPKAADRKKIDADDYRIEKSELELRNFVEHSAKDWYDYVKAQLKAADSKEPDQVKELMKLVSLIKDDFEFEHKRAGLINDYKKYAKLIRNNAARLRSTQQLKDDKGGNAPINIQNDDHYQYASVADFYAKHADRIGDKPFKFQTGYYEKKNEKFLKTGAEFGGTKVQNFQFWKRIIVKRGNTEETIYKIDRPKYLNFLEELGYGILFENGQMALVQITDNIVSNLGDYVSFKIKQLIRDFLEKNNQAEVYEAWTAVSTQYTALNFLEELRCPKLTFLKDSREASYQFFRNGAVKITPKGISLVEYKELDGMVWKHHIKQHDFEVTDNVAQSDYFKYLGGAFLGTKWTEGEALVGDGLVSGFSKFMNVDYLKKLDSEDQIVIKKLFSALSAVGYWCDGWRNKAEPKILVTVDANPDGGGGGKSNFFNFLGLGGDKRMRTVQALDGKSLKTSYQWWKNDLHLKNADGVHLEDVTYNFDIRALYNLVTGDVHISGKGSTKDYIVSFEDSARLGISTNYFIMGLTASHARRRTHILEVSDFFNDKHTIQEFLKRSMFDDWDTEQWNLYYNLLISCIQFFKHLSAQNDQGQGLLPFPTLGYTDREFSIKCPEWTHGYFDSLIPTVLDEWQPNPDMRTTQLNDMYAAFKEECKHEIEEWGKKMTVNQFSRYLVTYCEHNHILINSGMDTEKKRDRRRIIENGRKKRVYFVTLVWNEAVPDAKKMAYEELLGVLINTPEKEPEKGSKEELPF